MLELSTEAIIVTVWVTFAKAESALESCEPSNAMTFVNWDEWTQVTHKPVVSEGHSGDWVGIAVRLVGADPSLGTWDPKLAWPLDADPQTPDRYTSKVLLPGRLPIRCKLVVVHTDGTVTWETGWDRRLAVGDRETQAIDLKTFR